MQSSRNLLIGPQKDVGPADGILGPIKANAQEGSSWQDAPLSWDIELPKVSPGPFGPSASSRVAGHQRDEDQGFSTLMIAVNLPCSKLFGVMNADWDDRVPLIRLS